MSNAYLWVKALHIIFVASWFAGLFYLPRLFVNLAMVPADSHAERERLLIMARKLYRFSTILMVPALVLGFLLWLYFGIGKGPGQIWIHIKLLLVFGVVGYHHMCRACCARLKTCTTAAPTAGIASSTRCRCCCLRPSSSSRSSSPRWAECPVRCVRGRRV
jgi:putative membrane protein